MDSENDILAFENLAKIFEKTRPVIAREGLTIPRFYIRYLSETEDFVNEQWEDKKVSYLYSYMQTRIQEFLTGGTIQIYAKMDHDISCIHSWVNMEGVNFWPLLHSIHLLTSPLLHRGGGGGQAKFFASFFAIFLRQIFWYIFNKLAFLALHTMAVLTENTKKTKELLEN